RVDRCPGFRHSNQQLLIAQRGVFAFFSKNTSELSGVVSSPLVGPLAAWMPPSSPMDGFTASPASGEGTAHSANRAFALDAPLPRLAG
ncbi:hypothetical protein LN528_17290, partial [Xanthomonas vesicatoria]|nr:hypothetical protein [Xanthomonas vesicatoria]